MTPPPFVGVVEVTVSGLGGVVSPSSAFEQDRTNDTNVNTKAENKIKVFFI